MSKSFGHEDRYYSGWRAQQFSSDTSEVQLLSDVLGDEADELKRQVQVAKDKWSRRTQDWVRTETKLKLTHDGNAQAIPVKVADGLPPPFAIVVKRYQDDPELWHLLRNRSVLEDTVRGLDLVGGKVEKLKDRYKELKNIGSNPPPGVSSEMFVDVKKFIKKLLELLKKGDIVKDLSNIQLDVLGAYFFKVPCIHLYWMPIALMAKILNVPVDALTAVVLIHERVHAYTHHGFDTDGEQWETHDFADAEVPVVEGLAQYYTHVICRQKSKYPELWETYNVLLKNQPSVYQVHNDWELERSRAGEVVRNTLILSRAKPIKEYDSFLNTLGQSWEEQGQWRKFDVQQARKCLSEREESRDESSDRF